jgi:hypothetical protein
MAAADWERRGRASCARRAAAETNPTNHGDAKRAVLVDWPAESRHFANSHALVIAPLEANQSGQRASTRRPPVGIAAAVVRASIMFGSSGQWASYVTRPVRPDVYECLYLKWSACVVDSESAD